MASTRASGTNAVRYGTMRENVLALTVVLADGRIIKTARRARKSSAGYDLTRLFVGAEGTLGIITEVTLRLYGIPEAISAAVCPFESLEGAVNTVIETIQMGIPVARIELLDDVTMDCVIQYSQLTQYKAEPMLFFEFHGTPAGVEEQARMVGEIAQSNGGGDFQWTANAEERNRLWQARHDVNWALGLLKQTPEETMLATDVCVPISCLADCIMETKRDLDETGLRSGIVGHVGDGNFHMGIVTDFNDPVKKKTAMDFSDRLTERALAMGGTCTGEHGVGMGKMKFLQAEHGEALSVMRQLKLALDPQNIMNPGKMIRV
jgi:D-lactate dehydrogenase (cytochrome)